MVTKDTDQVAGGVATGGVVTQTGVAADGHRFAVTTFGQVKTGGADDDRTREGGKTDVHVVLLL